MMKTLRAFALLACLAAVAHAQSAPGSAASSELRAQRAFDAAKASPPALDAFLRNMPKGADLHVHLSGAVYAESFLNEAAADHLCINTATSTLIAGIGNPPACAAGQVPAATVFTNQHLYDQLVDAFSMRSFVPSAGISGHDQFFATFDRFNALGNQHADEWLDEVTTRAAQQNEQYMEVMQTPPFDAAIAAAKKAGWSGDVSPAALGALRQKLFDAGLRDDIAADRAEFDGELVALRQLRQHCGTGNAQPGCSVEVRFLYQVLRGFPPQQVFAQTLLGFEVAAADPEQIAGINFVMPEDGYLSMHDYELQMKMLDYLHSVYPTVHISLHAGELAPGLVAPNGLRFHIRQAIDLGHAERIGHGVDIMQEEDPSALLKEMADKHIMVEINLTSNDVILGVSKPNHPLPLYRAAHVPVALSTDDEGVSRIDLTHEYTRAALEYNLTYRDLKNMARTSLEHAFLSGDSLWQQHDVFAVMHRGCIAPKPTATGDPTPGCDAFLKTSQRAQQQWELERRFAVFESRVH